MSGFDPIELLFTASALVLPVLIAITFHEAAHGFVAWRLGDDTAYRQGRVTFNPVKHVDPFGTVFLPALLFLSGARFLFGYAKPVPVRFDRLRKPRRDMVLVAAAGPAINLVLALISALLVHIAVRLPGGLQDWTLTALFTSIYLNVLLAVFNMLPLPPLDGGRVAVGLLPARLALPLARLERWGIIILVAGLFLLPLLGRQVGLDLDPFGWLIGGPVRILQDIVASLAGLT
jgi:Zn-dependent protease